MLDEPNRIDREPTADEAWRKMAELLDREMPVRRSYALWWRPVAMAASLLVAAFGLWFLIADTPQRMTELVLTDQTADAGRQITMVDAPAAVTEVAPEPLKPFETEIATMRTPARPAAETRDAKSSASISAHGPVAKGASPTGSPLLDQPGQQEQLAAHSTSTDVGVVATGTIVAADKLVEPMLTANAATTEAQENGLPASAQMASQPRSIAARQSLVTTIRYPLAVSSALTSPLALPIDQMTTRKGWQWGASAGTLSSWGVEKLSWDAGVALRRQGLVTLTTGLYYWQAEGRERKVEVVQMMERLDVLGNTGSISTDYVIAEISMPPLRFVRLPVVLQLWPDRLVQPRLGMAALLHLGPTYRDDEFMARDVSLGHTVSQAALDIASLQTRPNTLSVALTVGVGVRLSPSVQLDIELLAGGRRPEVVHDGTVYPLLRQGRLGLTHHFGTSRVR